MINQIDKKRKKQKQKRNYYDAVNEITHSFTHTIDHASFLVDIRSVYTLKSYALKTCFVKQMEEIKIKTKMKNGR